MDQDASFRYVNATSATTVASVPANSFLPGFDDSSWFVGNAPFSRGFGGDFANVNNPFAPGPTEPIPTTVTAWDVPFDPFLRTSFELDAPTAVTIWLAVDNGIQSMHLNGVPATAPVNLEGAAHRWEHVFDIAAPYTVAGTNVLALQLEDHGGATGFVMMLTADDAAVNPVFTINDPPPVGAAIPEPASISLLALGLAAAGARRIRRRVS